MLYRLRFEKRALKDLKKMEAVEAKRVILGIEKVKMDLFGDVKKLTAFSPRYRLRVGNFRVLFDIDEDEIVIHTIRDRREAY